MTSDSQVFVNDTDLDHARRRARWMGAIIATVIVVGAIFGAAYTLISSSSAAPTFPAEPPYAHSLGASQVTPMLGDNSIISTDYYRINESPAAVIAFYRRSLPNHGGTDGHFDTIITEPSARGLPTGLTQLPRTFVSGSTTRYTYTQYSKDGQDVGVAVDLRKPNGPTIVFVNMLSH